MVIVSRPLWGKTFDPCLSLCPESCVRGLEETQVVTVNTYVPEPAFIRLAFSERFVRLDDRPAVAGRKLTYESKLHC